MTQREAYFGDESTGLLLLFIWQFEYIDLLHFKLSFSGTSGITTHVFQTYWDIDKA